jgi:Ras-related protein Rab-6A
MNDSGMDISYQINRQKIIFTGDIAVGKTSIISVLMGQKFTAEYEASIGVDFFSKTMKYKGKIIKLQIWDSAGQEKFRSLIPNYIRGSSLVFIVYDISNRKSFENLSKWIDFVNNIENSNIVIVGNKIDLESKRVVKTEEGQKFCNEKNYEFFEVSAKDDTNLNNMLFNSVATLPFFNTINTDGFSKEQIVENLMKENLNSFRYQTKNNDQTDSTGAGINIINNDNKANNTNGDISLKENKNVINNNEETQVFHKKKTCC